MDVKVENEIKIIRMGDKGPNLLGVERAKEIIKELNYNECKAVIILGNDKVCLLYTSPSPRDRG